jgi:hypothetical protein
MALGASTFSDAGGAVSGVFAGLSAEDQAALQAQGLQITAQGTLITAQGTQINAEALQTEAAGNLAESENYSLAAGLAQANANFTAQSTRIQQAQTSRQITQTIGSGEAAVAASGFSGGGSAGDILRASASQGALAKGVLAQQGVITEAGYEEQATSYNTLATAGRAAAATQEEMATQTYGIASEQDQIAAQQQGLAQQTLAAGSTAAFGDFAGAALKGAAAIATLAV